MRRLICYVAAGVAAFAGASRCDVSYAVVHTWTGNAANALWSSGSNWNPQNLSTSGTHSVYFTGANRTLNYVNANYSLDRLEFLSGASSFTIGGTGANKTLFMRGDVVNSSAVTQTIGGTTSQTSLIVRYGTNTATRTIDTGAAGIVWNASLLDTAENVTLRKTGSGLLVVNNPPGGTQNFKGTFDLASGTTNINGSFNGGPTVINGSSSTLGLYGSITSGAVTNSGTATIAAQMGALTNSGYGVIESGAAIGGALVNTGTLRINGNVQVDGVGSNLSNGTVVFAGIGDPGTNPTVIFNNPVTLGGVLDIGLANTYPDADVNNQDLHTWNLFSFQGGNTSSFNVVKANYDSQTLTFSKGVYPEEPDLWVSTATTNGQWLTFNEITGDLVVVPEQSTVVFAGIGAVIAGLHRVTLRRGRSRGGLALAT